MQKHIYHISFFFFLLLQVFAKAQDLPRLHVEGRHLRDTHGNIVLLHGYAQTFSPWFNERGTQWTNYDVEGCLNYNQRIIDEILEAGWDMNFVRMHMDPYWSSTPGCEGRYEGEECFNEQRFIQYLDEVFVPMTEYAVSKGLYVILRPPGVAPERIEVGGVYQEFLLKVWGRVAQHPRLKNHPNVMYELANEPIDILGTDGTYGASSQGHFDNLKIYFQEIVDTIRHYADNILWIPGLGYQSLYQGFAVNPIEGENIGYAVHVYPGWFNSGSGYEPFQRGWDNQVAPVAEFAPIVVTEMDWAPEEYESSWGTGITGTAGGEGFGANFKKIVDDEGNVSWLLFTEPHLLAQFDSVPPADGEEYTFLNDPEACPWPIFHWYQEYAKENFPRPEYQFTATADNGDGTFSNPIIRGDFQNPELLRRDNTFYLISTNNLHFPSATILESKDLVSWSYSDVAYDELPLENIIYINEGSPEGGSMVELASGEWWTVKSTDQGALGDFPQLIPVNMDTGDPQPDESLFNGSGINKPQINREYIPSYITTNDVFRDYIMKPQWFWKGDTDTSAWSLVDRAGFLRLKTSQVVNGIHEIDNVLSQRMLSMPDEASIYATVRLELDNLKNGDVAGLSVYEADPAHKFIGVRKVAGESHIVYFDGSQTDSVSNLNGSEIYFRSIVNTTTNTFDLHYSLDNENYQLAAQAIPLYDQTAAGSKFGVFIFATEDVGGFVDIDWFSTESTFGEDQFYADDFEPYTRESLTLKRLLIEGGNTITVQTSSTYDLSILAEFQDGQTEDVGDQVEFTNLNPDVINMSWRGDIVALKDGNATVTLSYQGPLGGQSQDTLHINSTAFPLKSNLFNPDIWENGSFDEQTKTIQTGQFGFAGWEYDGIDLSDYKYIVVRLGSANNANIDFRLFACIESTHE